IWRSQLLTILLLLPSYHKNEQGRTDDWALHPCSTSLKYTSLVSSSALNGRSALDVCCMYNLPSLYACGFYRESLIALATRTSLQLPGVMVTFRTSPRMLAQRLLQHCAYAVPVYPRAGHRGNPRTA